MQPEVRDPLVVHRRDADGAPVADLVDADEHVEVVHKLRIMAVDLALGRSVNDDLGGVASAVVTRTLKLPLSDFDLAG